MSKPAILPAGRELTDWIRTGGKPERASSSILWLYRWRALWLERSYQALLNSGPAAAPFPFADGEGLVFVQGFWRSGTTLLHEILSELPGCTAPRTWQCMDPSAMLTSAAQPRTNQSVQRPMDEVTISLFSPQEDEFALLALGCPSVYRGFLNPRRLPELGPLTNPSYWATESQSWMKVLEAFLAWCRKPDQKRLILKSPNHAFRTFALAEHFPKARFVWILRDPAAVWESNLKMWRAMIERYGLWAVRGRELEEFLELALHAYADLLQAMWGKDCFRVRPAYSYEALIRDPKALLPRLVEELGIGPWSELPLELRASLLARPHSATEQRELSKDAPVALLRRLRDIQDMILHNRPPASRSQDS